MSAIELLCTDFDGTLIEFSLYSHCTKELAEVIVSHKQKGGSWVINTGRSFHHTLEGLQQFNGPILPDYIITLEREIYYFSSSGGWQDFGDWNRICRNRHQTMLMRCENELNTICQEIARQAEGEVTLLYEEGNFTGLMTSNEEVMERVVLELDRAFKDLPECSYQRNTVYIRFCHVGYHKGAALGELCRLTKIPRQFVFAIGDNFNDISMLDGIYATLCACPLNAVEKVKEVVQKANGYVASQNYASGVVEAIEYFLTAKVKVKTHI